MLLSIVEALDCIEQHIAPLQNEIIPIESAVGRIVAQSYYATFDLPRFDNSAMDGYAVKVSNSGCSVVVSDVIYAGDIPKISLQSGCAIKIMTGAPIPKECEAVVSIEEVTQEGEYIKLPKGIKEGNFIRKAGEDIAKGSCYLERGEEIRPYTIASLASQGVTHVVVVRKIKVAIFGTGDELCLHFEKIAPHQLYNSNSPMFLARAFALGCDTRLIQTAVDTLDALKSSILSTLDVDIVVTSGGVSVGDKDFTKQAFEELGMQTLFDGVDIKPGRPTVVGKIGDTTVINLPGNPLAAMVNFELFVRAVIRKMSGRKERFHGTITTKLKQEVRLKGGKTTALLGSFDGDSFVLLRNQKPGMVLPMQKADGMILISSEVSYLPEGEVVKMLPIVWECTSQTKSNIFC